jgi:hypothetical protein
LASIMGSGFLVSAPLLGGIVGNLAVVCMAMLLVLAYAVGGAIRFNIRHFEPIENVGHGPAQTVAFLSRVPRAHPPSAHKPLFDGGLYACHRLIRHPTTSRPRAQPLFSVCTNCAQTPIPGPPLTSRFMQTPTATVPRRR